MAKKATNPAPKKEKQEPFSFDQEKTYTVAEAAEMLPEISTSKFVGSVEIDLVINRTKKQENDTLKGSLTLPHQFGSEKKIIVFTDESNAKAAKEAGAVDAGLEDLIKKVEKSEVEFDIAIATPDVMAKIAKLGKILGPKGLMPNPASGTVTADFKKAIATFKEGRQNFRMSDQGVVRTKVAKLDMSSEAIAENIKAFTKAVMGEARKFGIQPFKKITVAPTMGRSVKLDIASALE